jgi:endoglucanase
MVGAEDPNDKNPLYYKDLAVDFFSRISKEFKDYDNVLYEIMNEPNGSTTWAHCKEYANLVIPKIRENTDGIILVGNPNWTSNLNVVMSDPLEGYENIMYTYHFYAADHKNRYQVENAYNKGFPVFISEHGGMESSGDGEMSYESITQWYKILDNRNISYVAWNLSNSKGSASILKHGTPEMDNFSDEVLKEWGVWYKAWVRKKFNFPGQR